MIQFDRFKLDNGLTVLFHKDTTTPMAVVNILYNVGARDESEEKTGFAHLFEHLMFGGSVNIPEFDTPLQLAGGENNAFTSNDITNYYDVLPVNNIETALWLESDRMKSLAFTPKSLEVQRSVVIEEFKQRYLNQPYGDVWLELRPLVYKEHPYKWATIGKEIKHIEEATMEDVKGFFKKFYHPANAIMCIGGNMELDEVKRIVEKWFGDIPAGEINQRNLPQEQKQTEFRQHTIERDVPTDAFYYAFRMEDRLHPDYLVYDTLSDILGRDKSSRLYKSLKKEQNLVSNISAYVTGSVDSGLLVISGKLSDGVTFDQFDTAFWKEMDSLIQSTVSEDELKRIKVKIRTSNEFQQDSVLNRAMALCMNELLGDADMINHESEKYASITAKELQELAASTLIKTNCTLLNVKANNAK